MFFATFWKHLQAHIWWDGKRIAIDLRSTCEVGPYLVRMPVLADATDLLRAAMQ